MSVQIEGISYFKIEKKPTVSIGVYEILPDSVLTDRGVREYADKAHVFAKDASRNRIATFSDDRYEKLEVLNAC